MTDRVITLIDMDCFYCQVEARLNPSLIGQPMAVIQYNQWKEGGIIAVNYEARDRGVTRFMRGEEAKKHCPEIILVSVPTVRDKADLTRYRDAGREVLSILCRFDACVQRASVDEAYIDLTKIVEERMKTYTEFCADVWKSTFVVGYSKNSFNDEDERKNGLKTWLEHTESLSNTASLKLAVGALIVEEMREAILSETSFKCSAGIAHNKILAKLACGLHKPNRQTILPLECVSELYKSLPVKKIKNLGGKFGDDVVEKLDCQTMSDLLKFSEKKLQTVFNEKAGTWLYNIARGTDNEPVTARLLSKSIGCCKKFPGRTALQNTKDVHHWLNKLAEELSERLLEDEVMNKRRANLLTVSMQLEINKRDIASSKSVTLSSYETDKIVIMADQALRKVCKVDSTTSVWSPSIKFLGLSAGKFSNTSNKILRFFKISENSEIEKHKTIENTQNAISFSRDESRSSFFERAFQLDISNSNKKLNIVPDISKNDLYVDSEDSQGSLIKPLDQKRDIPDVNKKENLKKKLFSTQCDHTELQLSKSHSEPKSNSKNEILFDQPTQRINPKNIVKKNTIVNFFSHNFKKEEWVKLDELFPDISQIDEELLESLPISYRTKILEMRRENSSKSVSKNSKNEEHIITNNTVNSDIESINSSNTENGSVQCKECGEIVLVDYELHLDMHLAMKLDKELNSESGVTINVNTNLRNTKENKRKVKTNSKKNNEKNAKKIKSIDTFFKK